MIKRSGVRIIAILLLTVMLLTGNTVAADSISYNEYALNLYSIGLFRGTEVGFELDRMPTRLEGAVMFVRLLGGEQEAIEENYYHPFTDVPDWGNPYVGYLYHYRLTNGVSSSEFGSYQDMKAAEYITFGLRALGYSDSGPEAQFSWNTSAGFAKSNDIFSDNLDLELQFMDFTRGHVAWVSYELLHATLHEEAYRLIDSLIAEGSINENSAGTVFPEYNFGKRNVPAIGDSWAAAISENGQPTDDFPSRYGFDWHIFGMDYSNYIQIGESGGVIRGVLSASAGYSYEKGISIGMTKENVISAYGSTGLTEIRKLLPGGNSAIVYILDNTDKATYIGEDGEYITYFYDSYNDNRITAFLVIDRETEESTHSTFTGDIDLLENAYEEQIYHLTNAFRTQLGVEFLVKNLAAADAARDHSDNMVANDFFSHTDPEGRGPGDRASEKGVPYRHLAENLAYGYVNPVDMVNGWFNSGTGHREALLGDFIYIGVGSAIKDSKVHYCTQEYWR